MLCCEEKLNKPQNVFSTSYFEARRLTNKNFKTKVICNLSWPVTSPANLFTSDDRGKITCIQLLPVSRSTPHAIQNTKRGRE